MFNLISNTHPHPPTPPYMLHQVMGKRPGWFHILFQLNSTWRSIQTDGASKSTSSTGRLDWSSQIMEDRITKRWAWSSKVILVIDQCEYHNHPIHKVAVSHIKEPFSIHSLSYIATINFWKCRIFATIVISDIFGRNRSPGIDQLAVPTA